jgi:hypothetical protein
MANISTVASWTILDVDYEVRTPALADDRDLGTLDEALRWMGFDHDPYALSEGLLADFKPGDSLRILPLPGRNPVPGRRRQDIPVEFKRHRPDGDEGGEAMIVASWQAHRCAWLVATTVRRGWNADQIAAELIARALRDVLAAGNQLARDTWRAASRLGGEPATSWTVRKTLRGLPVEILFSREPGAVPDAVA